MKNRLLTLSVAVAALASAGGSAWSTSVAVVSSAGKPVSGARVYAFLGDTAQSKKILLHANSKGKLTFNPPIKGRYYYLAEAEGYGYAMAYDRRDAPGKPIKIRLWPERKLKGVVVDTAGKPVRGAMLCIHAFDAWEGSADVARNAKPWIWFRDQPSFTGRVTTDKNGKFVLRHIPNWKNWKKANLRLDLTDPGRASISKYLYYADLNKPLKIVSPVGCTLSGTVYLPGKTGVAPKGLEISATFSIPGVGGDYRIAFLDKNGRFSFAGLPPGRVYLALGPKYVHYTDQLGEIPGRKDDWILPAVPKMQLDPKKPANLELVLMEGALVSGKVVDKATGKAASDGYVSIQHSGMPNGQSDNARINGNGEFSLRVAPGHVKVSIEYCQIDGRYVSSRNPDGSEAEAGLVEFDVAEGEKKSDVVCQVDSSVTEQSYYLEPARGLPSGFELKPGTYKLAWEPNLLLNSATQISAGAYGDQAGAKMGKLPKLKSKSPIYIGSRIDSDTDLLYMVFDRSGKYGARYDIAYVDANRNGDLTDDKPITWQPQSSYGVTPWVEIASHQGVGDGRRDNPVKIRWQMRDGQPGYLQRKGCWKGSVETSKGPVRVILADTQGNGVYNDHWDSSGSLNSALIGLGQGDQIGLDTQSANGSVSSWFTALTQGQANVLGTKAYSISANEVGDEITIAPYAGPMGKLGLGKVDIGGRSGKISYMYVSGTQGLYQCFDLKGQSVSLPAGQYVVSAIGLSLPGGKQPAEISGTLNKTVTVKAGEQTLFGISGKPRLVIQPDKREVVLRPGVKEAIAWGYEIGDALKNTYAYFGNSSALVVKARFDSSKTAIPVEPQPGGG